MPSRQAKKSEKESPNKSEFVRAHPNRTGPEIVKLAKEQGLTISENLVYNVRSQDKKKKDTSSKGGQAARLPPAPAGSSSFSPLESQFRSLVLRLGLDRSGVLLRSIAESVDLDPEEDMGRSQRTSSAPVAVNNAQSAA